VETGRFSQQAVRSLKSPIPAISRLFLLPSPAAAPLTLFLIPRRIDPSFNARGRD
jgi:hypothetical protein